MAKIIAVMAAFFMAAFVAICRAAGGLLVYWLIGEMVELVSGCSELLSEIGWRLADIELG